MMAAHFTDATTHKVQFVGGPFHEQEVDKIEIRKGTLLTTLLSGGMLHTYYPVGKLCGGSLLAIYLGPHISHHLPGNLCVCAACPTRRWGVKK